MSATPNPRSYQAAIPGELLSVAQAAERLGTPVRFIRRLVAERRIRFYKVGRYVRFALRDLDDFIAAGCVEPGQPENRCSHTTVDGSAELDRRFL